MPRKKSSKQAASLAGQALGDENASEREKSLAASVVSQAEPDRTPVDPERARRHAEIRERVAGKTDDLRAGKLPGRARLGPTKKVT